MAPLDLDLDSLRVFKVVGSGAMGTVFLGYDAVSDPSGARPFALKVVEKSSKHDGDRRAAWEIEVLRKLSEPNASHPFLPSLLGSSHDASFFAWAVPFCPGGDLNSLRYSQTDRVFSPAAIRFYLAEIICALEHLHAIGIVYRDLKPENVLIQRSGHVTLTDFDLSRSLTSPTVKTLIFSSPDPYHKRSSRRLNPVRLVSFLASKKTKSARVSPVSRRKPSFAIGERSISFVGTEEYVSPEVVRGEGHEFAVDWWALGVLTYEMLYGKTPFMGKNRKHTFFNVLTKPPEFVGKLTALTDLIGRLLEKDPTRRLGYGRGACEIKEHVFFEGVKWDQLTEVLRPPFIPLKDDEALLTEKVRGAGVGVAEYMRWLRTPPLVSPVSPSPSFRRESHVSEF